LLFASGESNSSKGDNSASIMLILVGKRCAESATPYFSALSLSLTNLLTYYLYFVVGVNTRPCCLEGFFSSDVIKIESGFLSWGIYCEPQVSLLTLAAMFSGC